MDSFKQNKNSVFSAAQCENKKYEAFGNLIWADGTYEDNREFTGKEKDPTGFHYFGARYYSGDIGRFLSPDPHTLYPGNLNLANSQELNPYVYCYNDPVNHYDPNGEFAQVIAPVLGLALLDAIIISGTIILIVDSQNDFEATKEIGKAVGKGTTLVTKTVKDFINGGQETITAEDESTVSNSNEFGVNQAEQYKGEVRGKQEAELNKNQPKHDPNNDDETPTGDDMVPTEAEKEQDLPVWMHILKLFHEIKTGL